MSQTEPTIVTLNELMGKFYNIGKRDYNGKVYDNVMSIFDELSLEEQKHLLRGCLGLYIAASSTVIHEQELIDAGNIDEMLRELRYMKKNKGSDPKSNQERSLPTQDTGLHQHLTGLKTGAIVIFIIVLAHLFLLASHDDPDAIQSAKVYKNLIDIVQIFSK